MSDLHDKDLLDHPLFVRSANSRQSGILDLESLFFSLAFLEKARESISHSISFFLTILNVEIVWQELLSLLYLTRAQALHTYKLTKIIMVRKNQDFIFTTF